MFEKVLNPPRATIVYRQSPDWQSLDYGYLDEVAGFEKMAMLPAGFIGKMIRTWDEIFPISYFSVRQRLKEIALRNLNEVRHAKVIDLEKFRSQEKPTPICLFVDDDDFFHPAIVDRLLPFAKLTDGLVWKSILFKGDIKIRQEVHCFTNNYAVTNRYLKSKFAERLTSVEQHFRATRIFKGSNLDYCYLNERLSVANKHPCSPAMLWNIYNENFSKADLYDHVRSFAKLRPFMCLDKEDNWAKPYLDDVHDCFADLLTGEDARLVDDEAENLRDLSVKKSRDRSLA